MNVHGEGPIPAEIMIVGEAPASEDELAGRPFVDRAGQELTRMLHEAGITRNECFVTNVCRKKPPWGDMTKFIPTSQKAVRPNMVLVRDKYCDPAVADGYNMLKREIDVVKPNVILALGNTALWALTGNNGIGNWRGSQLKSDLGPKVIPTYSPAAVLRQWEWRFMAVQDMRRVTPERYSQKLKMPAYDFVVRPNFAGVMNILETLYARVQHTPMKLSVDIETRRRHTACVGLAWNKLEALCIPFMCTERHSGYWLPEQEEVILLMLRKLLCHPNCLVVGQNFLYDTQYFHENFRFIPNLVHDTMLRHHTAFPGLPKGLDFLSSMYCDFHQYWKGEGKEWNPAMPEEQLWTYNCKDAVITYEVDDALDATLEQQGLVEQADFQMSLFWPVLQMMLRGTLIDSRMRPKLAKELQAALIDREEWLKRTLGHSLNPRSSKQMMALIYDDFKLKPIISRKTKRPTLDDEAMQKLGEREPLLRPLFNTIADMRTVGVFKSTFIESEQDPDGRMRCSFNPAGTETYRFNSSTNAFGRGMNLQNVPSEKSKSVNKAKQRGSKLALPNVREIFIPDPGYVFFDMDLDRADLQVVVWESGDKELMEALQRGVDLHLLNACVLNEISVPPLDELIETHPQYPEHRARWKGIREFAKTFIHGTNYGGMARTMAAHTGTTVHQSEMMQRRWFSAHPGILEWHKRVERDVMTKRCVYNKFGYRRFYFDRVENLRNEALAWIPQSTVANVINKALVRIAYELPEVQILLQVHDSIGGQFPLENPELEEEILLRGLVEIPYDIPLTIPCGIKTSAKSWGDC